MFFGGRECKIFEIVVVGSQLICDSMFANALIISSSLIIGCWICLRHVPPARFDSATTVRSGARPPFVPLFRDASPGHREVLVCARTFWRMSVWGWGAVSVGIWPTYHLLPPPGSHPEGPWVQKVVEGNAMPHPRDPFAPSFSLFSNRCHPECPPPGCCFHFVSSNASRYSFGHSIRHYTNRRMVL